jgi:hypothetical protein
MVHSQCSEAAQQASAAARENATLLEVGYPAPVPNDDFVRLNLVTPKLELFGMHEQRKGQEKRAPDESGAKPSDHVHFLRVSPLGTADGWITDL